MQAFTDRSNLFFGLHLKQLTPRLQLRGMVTFKSEVFRKVDCPLAQEYVFRTYSDAFRSFQSWMKAAMLDVSGLKEQYISHPSAMTSENLYPARGNRQEFDDHVPLQLTLQEIENYTALLDGLVANADFRQNLRDTEPKLWYDTRRSLVVKGSRAHLVQCSFCVEKPRHDRLGFQKYWMTLTILCRQFVVEKPIKTFDVGDVKERLQNLSLKDS